MLGHSGRRRRSERAGSRARPKGPMGQGAPRGGWRCGRGRQFVRSSPATRPGKARARPVLPWGQGEPRDGGKGDREVAQRWVKAEIQESRGRPKPRGRRESKTVMATGRGRRTGGPRETRGHAKQRQRWRQAGPPRSPQGRRAADGGLQPRAQAGPPGTSWPRSPSVRLTHSR